MYRSHYNGELRLADVNKQVKLVGWVSKRRNLGSLLFIDLRDRSGIVQVLVKTDEIAVPEIRNEYLITVTGVIRQKDVANPNLATGAIEVVASQIEVLNKALNPPLLIADETDALEEVRLKYRYLDLRRPIMQEKLMIRAKIVKAAHRYLDDHGFIEIETPILTKSTPGGARDFLVPSRLHPGSFYALPQSPQIYKQLLMISGFERYYQVARCFRDEDLRADRQPDFSQIDIEMSFLEQEEILTLIEGLAAEIFKEAKDIAIKLPLRRLTYLEAMSRYGSDKPDTRFGLELQDIKSLFASNQADFFTHNQFVKAIVVENIANNTSRKNIDEIAQLAKKYDLRTTAVLKYIDGELTGSLRKLISDDEAVNLVKHLALTNNAIVIIGAANSFTKISFGLGAVRLYCARLLDMIKPDTYDLLWVTDFPLFEYDETTGKYASLHHPFTRPKDSDLHLLATNPAAVTAQAYDIVINGNEAGGGSLRIYDGDVQKRVFEILGMSDDEIKAKFGFFVDALKYGTPPHGGLAFGLDRLAMILGGTDNIRDVIAFPKNMAGVSPMSDEPTPVDDYQLSDLSIKITDQ